MAGSQSGSPGRRAWESGTIHGVCVTHQHGLNTRARGLESGEREVACKTCPGCRRLCDPIAVAEDPFQLQQDALLKLWIDEFNLGGTCCYLQYSRSANNAEHGDAGAVLAVWFRCRGVLSKIGTNRGPSPLPLKHDTRPVLTFAQAHSLVPGRGLKAGRRVRRNSNATYPTERSGAGRLDYATETCLAFAFVQ